jgi:ParB family chromosome partitioning protein
MVATSTADKASGSKKIVGGIKAISKGRSDTFHLDPALIQIDETFNARDFTTPENIAHVNFLENSIEHNGVKEPLKIAMRGDVPFVTNGESRLRAIRQLAKRGIVIETVPVRLEERYANDADRLYTQVTSNSGKNFTPMETSHLYRRMINLGQTVEQIAERTSMDVRRVKQILDYQTLPSEVQHMITSGTIKTSLAMATFVEQGRDEKATVETLKAAIDNAAEAGAPKVSRKFVGGTGGTKKASKAKVATDGIGALKAIFEKAQFDADEDDKLGEVVIITVSKIDEARIRQIIGY